MNLINKKGKMILMFINILIIKETTTNAINKINEEIILNMIQSCLLAFPEPTQNNQRDVCLLHIEDYYQTTSVFNNNERFMEDGVFTIRKISNCLELESAQNFNGGLPNFLPCDANNKRQLWFLRKENSFFKISNAIYNKCLEVQGMSIIVNDCVENKIEQTFNTNNFGGDVEIRDHNGYCLDPYANPTITQTCSSTKRVKIAIENIMLVNPFFNKSITADFSSNTRISNLKKNDLQIFDLYLLDPVTMIFVIYNPYWSVSLYNLLNETKLKSDSFINTVESIFNLEFINSQIFRIKSVNTISCVAIDSFQSDESSYLLMESCQTSQNQLWRLIKF